MSSRISMAPGRHIKRSGRAHRPRSVTEPDGWSLRVGKAFSHPARIGALRLLAKGRCSPSDAASSTSGSVGVLAYHMRCLKAAGLIHVVDTQAVRGALEHFYELTDDGRTMLKALDAVQRLDPSIRL
jgi:DNA-binding transcriptional ArsR family regulator